MELIFVRHGQGEHNRDIPDRLNIEHPHLTDRGKAQVADLRASFDFSNEDIFIVSPTVRTIETVNILTDGLTQPKKYISPAVGPRMFPQGPESAAFRCDIALPRARIINEYPGFIVMNDFNEPVWLEGINAIEEKKFQELGLGLINWIREQGLDRAVIVAHDGTINSYRQLLGERGLTRLDFLGEAGTFKVAL
ncbi:histidine phosphatase family protein [Paenibacillus sp. sptzw28]|uniref:histidine phosphatase family protein n=1 Tax=Paenibacillus sp. sptzw28 TaxID=715179 RepID=UPI001C6F3498|nr:histidine phosphatase family protein [Paenibacillus sp. sptzw28]QYR21316.1 histidine phosphatase family protein [Paenibacillus sp. sptzw28]